MSTAVTTPTTPTPSDAPTNEPFRFYDNREKYLLFVTTTSEKAEVATRIGASSTQLKPTPPALRVFDAGTGNGVVLSQRAPRPASPDADGALRGRRQGDQHGGHPAHAGRPPRPTRRAPRHGRRADQHVLRRGAEPVPALTGQPGQGPVVGRPARGQLRRSTTTSRSRASSTSSQTGWQTSELEERQPGVRQAVGARAVPQPTVRSRLHDIIPRNIGAAAGVRLRPGARRPALPLAHGRRAQGAAPCSRRSPARWHRTDGSSSCSRPATTRGWRSCGASGPTTNRSRPRATCSSRSSTGSSTAMTVRRRTRSTA